MDKNINKNIEKLKNHKRNGTTPKKSKKQTDKRRRQTQRINEDDRHKTKKKINTYRIG